MGSSPSLSHCQFLFPLYFCLYFFPSHWLWLGLRSDCLTVRSGTCLKIWACVLCFALTTPSPSDMPAWYPLRLDPWQLSLKYSNSATELPGDSVVLLVRAWQAICQVVGSSPSLSHCQFIHWLDLADCQVWACLKMWACASLPPHHYHYSNYSSYMLLLFPFFIMHSCSQACLHVFFWCQT